jgi:hypothetical protein
MTTRERMRRITPAMVVLLTKWLSGLNARFRRWTDEER